MEEFAYSSIVSSQKRSNATSPGAACILCTSESLSYLNHRELNREQQFHKQMIKEDINDIDMLKVE